MSLSIHSSESLKFVQMLTQLKNKSNYERIELILSTLLATALLIEQKVVIILILALCLNTVYGGVTQGFIRLNRAYLPFVFIFLFYLLGLIFTVNFEYGLKDIETRLTFLLFPLIYGIVNRKTTPSITWIVWGFMIGALYYMAVSWYQAIQCAGEEQLRFCFESSKLANWIHPTYVALYLMAGSIFILIDAFQRQMGWFFKIFTLSIALVTFSFIYHLYSLGPWIAFVGLMVVFSFTFFYLRKQLKYFLGFVLLISVAGVFAINNLELLRSDYDAVANELKAYSEDSEKYILENQHNTESVKARLIIWNVSVDFILENPFGVGTGDRKDELQKYYRENGMDEFANKELNPHSQYLQTAMSIGILAGLFLIGTLFYYFWIGFMKGNFYLITLITLFSVASLFESILERQWGILFFMFFLVIFITDNLKSKQLIQANSR